MGKILQTTWHDSGFALNIEGGLSIRHTGMIRTFYELKDGKTFHISYGYGYNGGQEFVMILDANDAESAHKVLPQDVFDKIFALIKTKQNKHMDIQELNETLLAIEGFIKNL